MLGSCYNMNLNILDGSKDFVIADPMMGFRYNINLFISDTIHVKADPMLGSCYNMNWNILDRNQEFLIADPIMGSRYNMNLYISDVTH